MPSLLSLTPGSPLISSGVTLSILVHLALVNRRMSRTASVALPSHKSLTEGVRGRLYSHAFPIAFHTRLAWRAHARQVVSRLNTAVVAVLELEFCPSDTSMSLAMGITRHITNVCPPPHSPILLQIGEGLG